MIYKLYYYLIIYFPSFKNGQVQNTNSFEEVKFIEFNLKISNKSTVYKIQNNINVNKNNLK